MQAKTDLYPLTFNPIYQDYVWGGDRLASVFQRSLPADRCAESWELADRPEGMSVVSNGVLAGTSLHDLLRTRGEAVVGRGKPCDTFPLLIKLIDAKERLSVQVHPGNETANRVPGAEPKTELWIVLDSMPGAYVYAGLKDAVDETVLRRALKGNTMVTMLKRFPVKKGDAVYIPGGRVHAIGEGCLLLEIQQCSNTTYRLYDWGRKGADGKLRELHIEQALTVIDWEDHDAGVIPSPEHDESQAREIMVSPYFAVSRINLIQPRSVSLDGATFHILFVEQGPVRIKFESLWQDVASGTTVLIPAGLTGYQLIPVSSACGLVRIHLP